MDEGAAAGAAAAADHGADRLPASRSEVPMLLWRDSAGSTNTELVRLAADSELPAFTTLVTTDQTAGRGRLDREWIAPAGTALAVSVLVRAPSGEGLGWLPLAAGAAMFDAVTAVLPPRVHVGIKWPNDVQLDGRKVCGILSELVPVTAAAPGVAVVIGAGLNLTMSAEQLPVPTATSLALAGAVADNAADAAQLLDTVLAAYLRSLTALVTALWQGGGDASRSGLRAAVVERCSTIGREVRVELPGGAQLLGRAIGIDGIGRLEVRDDAEQVRTVAAGDIVHLR
jgi:BirA family transcriptional regulator, biotin operon repressor / biotin---[acetyl-CoA-carboxylase] ligase